MKKILYILSLCFLFICCEKEEIPKPEKLDDKLSFLIGEWKWDYSVEKQVNKVNGEISFQIIEASNYEGSFYLIFSENGYVSELYNDSLNIYPMYINLVYNPPYCLGNDDDISVNFDLQYEEESDGFSDMVICGNKDVNKFKTSGINLPLNSYETELYKYTYSHYYIKQ